MSSTSLLIRAVRIPADALIVSRQKQSISNCIYRHNKLNFAFWKNPSFASASDFKKGRPTVQKFLTVFTTSALTSLYFTFAQAHPAEAAVFDGFIATAKKVFPNDENLSNIIGSGIPLVVGVVAVGAIATGVAQENRSQDATAAFRLGLTLFVAIGVLEIVFKKLYTA